MTLKKKGAAVKRTYLLAAVLRYLPVMVDLPPMESMEESHIKHRKMIEDIC